MKSHLSHWSLGIKLTKTNIGRFNSFLVKLKLTFDSTQNSLLVTQLSVKTSFAANIPRTCHLNHPYLSFTFVFFFFFRSRTKIISHFALILHCVRNIVRWSIGPYTFFFHLSVKMVICIYLLVMILMVHLLLSCIYYSYLQNIEKKYSSLSMNDTTNFISLLKKSQVLTF